MLRTILLAIALSGCAHLGFFSRRVTVEAADRFEATLEALVSHAADEGGRVELGGVVIEGRRGDFKLTGRIELQTAADSRWLLEFSRTANETVFEIGSHNLAWVDVTAALRRAGVSTSWTPKAGGGALLLVVGGEPAPSGEAPAWAGTPSVRSGELLSASGLGESAPEALASALAAFTRASSMTLADAGRWRHEPDRSAFDDATEGERGGVRFREATQSETSRSGGLASTKATTTIGFGTSFEARVERIEATDSAGRHRGMDVRSRATPAGFADAVRALERSGLVVELVQTETDSFVRLRGADGRPNPAKPPP